MKNYKLLVPIVLVILFVASAFSIYDSNGENEKQYNNYLAAARSYAEQGIVVDAVENYAETLEIKDSFDIRMEIANLYRDNDEIDDAINWGEDMLETYPKNEGIYQYMMEIYEQVEDYPACFRLSDTMQKRKISTDNVADILDKIENYYFFLGRYEDVSTFGSGYAAVMKKNIWGFVNEEGKKVVKSEYLEVGSYRQDLAPVIDSESNAYFIDPEGNKKKVVLDVKNVVKLGLVEDDVYTLFNGETWGLYNGENEQLAGGYEEMSSFTNGVVAALKDEKWCLLNKDGKPVNSNTYDHVVQDEKGIVYRSDRMFVMESDGFYYLVDINGKKITETKYEDAKLFNDSTYAAVEVDGKWGFIDTNGNYFIQPQYEYARSFSNGFAAVMIDGKWGFINSDKQLAIENVFFDAKDFSSQGSVFVNTGDAWELLKLYKYNH